MIRKDIIMDDNDDAAPMAPAPQDPDSRVVYNREKDGGENVGGMMMGGDVNGGGVPSSFAAMEGGDGVHLPQQPAGGTSNGSGCIVGGDDEEGAVRGGGGGGGGGGEGGGSTGGGNLYLRPIFFGNLSHSCLATDVEKLFINPPPLPGGGGGMDDGAGEARSPFSLDRVDMKRGFCFVFLKDPPNVNEKRRCEDFVEEINGMNIPHVSNCLRAEFARGDGRIKRKEDERRKKIQPNETLFVVNFHEETTKREDLQMLFEPFGELIRIDMKRNYAFVQFKSIEDAIRARDATNGGKLDQSEITVEFVARTNPPPGDRGGNGGGRDDRRGGSGGGRRYDDRGEDVAGETTSVPDVMTTALEVAEVEGTAVIGTTMITVAAAAAGRDIAITIAVDVAPLAVAVAVLDIAGEAAEAGALDTTGNIASPVMNTAHPAVVEGTLMMIGTVALNALSVASSVDMDVPSIDKRHAFFVRRKCGNVLSMDKMNQCIDTMNY
ncbi:hypothetical protein ACHAXA_007057 [Cyclostephanos tholiformis]|uniref:RRM domain-containing protein n=1 Tax=Cyclostephanos tholiformis TaxID=382380 RepID=A0ABD3RAZ5_9STRA